MLPKCLMGDGIVLALNWLHIALGLLGSLANALWNLLGLAVSDPDLSVTVTDNNEGREGKAAPAGNDFGATIDVHDLFDEAAIFLFTHWRAAATATTRASPTGTTTPWATTAGTT